MLLHREKDVFSRKVQPHFAVNHEVIHDKYLDGLCSDSFGFLKNPVTLCGYVFVLIPCVRYGAASDCPQLLTMIVLCYRRSVIFASFR